MTNRTTLCVAFILALSGKALFSCDWTTDTSYVCITAFGDTECHWETYWDVTCAPTTINPVPTGPDPDAVGPAEVNGVNPRDQDDEGETDCFTSLVYAPNRPTTVPLPITRNLGWRYGGTNDGRRYRHNGIDIRAERGDPIFSARSGTVRRTDTGQINYRDDPGVPANGNYVRIDYDDGTQGVYLHLEGVNVFRDDRVLLGTQIGTADNSGRSDGDHLHYTRYDENGNVMDPEEIMDGCE